MERDRHSGDRGYILRDPSEYSFNELVDEIICGAQDRGIEKIVPGETFDDTSSVFTAEFQDRLQHLQEQNEFKPAYIQELLSEGITRKYVGTPRADMVFNSIDQIVSKVGQTIPNLDVLNELGLTTAHQVLFLRGIIIATTAQSLAVDKDPKKSFPERKQIIQKKSFARLNHFASNDIRIPRKITDETRARFSAAYAAAYLANAIRREIHVQGGPTYSSLSIDDAMHIPIPFGQLASGDQAEVLSVFPPGARTEHGDPEGYTPVYPIELDEERLRNLRNLQSTFGDSLTVFRYYESMQPFRRNGHSSSGGEGAPQDPEDREAKPNETYLVLEIEEHAQDGSKKIHVVAENRQVGNACYALRQEVLDEWERTTGLRMTWRDIFMQSRKAARQLGARDFHHNKNSDVKRRVYNYLHQDPEALIIETFAEIFDSKEFKEQSRKRKSDNFKELFDDNMEPTECNAMPPVMLDYIQRSQTLRDMWPTIRKYGYRNAMGLINAEEPTSKKEHKRREERKQTIGEFTADLLKNLRKADLDDLLGQRDDKS